jgi:periplasmic divalent cation tolerance protein
MSQTLNEYGVVLVTASSQAEAEMIANTLVEAKLAACVNLIPIRSIYTWKGEICRDEEWQLVIKTCLQNFSDLEAKVRSLHSYETPEILLLPITAGSRPCLQWLSETCNRDAL